MVLPPYKGGVFRGVFGAALRRLVCVVRDSDCPACILREKCLYPALFDPHPPPDFAHAAKFRKAPRPFVLNPPLTNRQVFYPGDLLAFDLTLIGPALEALPYFIHLFHEQGRRGLGRERGRFVLQQVDQIKEREAALVYIGNTRTFHSFSPERGPLHYPDDDFVNQITLEFLTPLRLKEKRDLVTTLTFPLLFERLMQRLNLLAAFYGDDSERTTVLERQSVGSTQTGEGNYWKNLPKFLKLAGQTTTSYYNLSWYDWERFSHYKKMSMKFGGLVGRVTYSGPLGPLMPYLRLGSVVNVGQATTFGLGSYRLTAICKETP